MTMTVSFEAEVLERLSDERQLTAYKHEGFWQPMDTLRDVRYLRALWARGERHRGRRGSN